MVREKGAKLPRILEHLSVCDFTKTDMKDWIWSRLYDAVTASHHGEQFETSTDSLKEIIFPFRSKARDTVVYKRLQKK